MGVSALKCIGENYERTKRMNERIFFCLVLFAHRSEREGVERSEAGAGAAANSTYCGIEEWEGPHRTLNPRRGAVAEKVAPEEQRSELDTAAR